MPQSTRGRGWFGDSEAHSKAGRKGGLARSRKVSLSNENIQNNKANRN